MNLNCTRIHNLSVMTMMRMVMVTLVVIIIMMKMMNVILVLFDYTTSVASPSTKCATDDTDDE